jgi:hypothetical protein
MRGLGLCYAAPGLVKVLEYRLYFLGKQGEALRELALSCADDRQAVAVAEAYATGAPMRLEREGRIVQAFPAGTPKAACTAPPAAAPGSDPDTQASRHAPASRQG